MVCVYPWVTRVGLDENVLILFIDYDKLSFTIMVEIESKREKENTILTKIALTRTQYSTDYQVI